jgi:hypothetical protein
LQQTRVFWNYAKISWRISALIFNFPLAHCFENRYKWFYEQHAILSESSHEMTGLPQKKRDDGRTQAERVFAKFGGVARLCHALEELGPEHRRGRVTIHKWNMPKEKGGTGGLIPSSALKSILLAAKAEGIVLTAEDLYSSTTK